MSKNEGYNGWTSYESWLVALWIDNDSSQQGYWLQEAKYYNGNAYELSKALKEHYYEMLPNDAGIIADLLRASIDSVNFYEIAENLLEDYKEQEQYEMELWSE